MATTWRAASAKQRSCGSVISDYRRGANLSSRTSMVKKDKGINDSSDAGFSVCLTTGYSMTAQ